MTANNPSRAQKGPSGPFGQSTLPRPPQTAPLCSSCPSPALWRESNAHARLASSMGLPILRACDTHRQPSMLPAYGGAP